MKLSIRQLDKELLELANAHLMINSYHFGNFLERMSESTIQYVTMMCDVNNASINQSYVTLNLEIMILDKITNSKADVLDVESDTLQILNDVYEVISYSDRWQDFGVIQGDFNPQKVVERSEDVVNGWYVTIPFKIKKENRGICDLPLNNYSYD